MQKDSYKTQTLIGVLDQLAGFYAGQQVVLVWDGLGAHWSHDMGAWLETQRPWLQVERLPAYAPELNAVEYLWANLKGVELANFAGDTLIEVADAAERGIGRVCDDEQLVQSFLTHTGLTLDHHLHPTYEDFNIEVDAKLILGEPAAACCRDLGLAHRREPAVGQPGQVGAGATGAVAIHHRPGRLPTALWALIRGQDGERVGATTAVSPMAAALISSTDDLTVIVRRAAGHTLSKDTVWRDQPFCGLTAIRRFVRPHRCRMLRRGL